MKPPKRKFVSKKFNDVSEVMSYFSDVEECPHIEAILFLAYKIQCMEYAHELLKSSIQVMISEVGKVAERKSTSIRRHPGK